MTAPRSRPLVLARLKPEYAPNAAPSEVHAYPVSADDTQTVLTARCGHVLEAGKGERVAMFAGAPCSVCLLFAMGAEGPVADRGGELPTELEYPFGQVGASGRYAVGLRGDRCRHLVADNAIRSTLDGSGVVHTICGHLGWGPLESAPEQWPLCPDCTGTTAIGV